MIIKYKTLYRLGYTVYLVRYPDENHYRVIVMGDEGEILGNEVVENEEWFASAIFEKFVHSEGKRW